jgi:hypothetical protein
MVEIAKPDREGHTQILARVASRFRADRVVPIDIKGLSIGKRHRDADLRQVSREEPVQGRLMITQAVS